MKKIILVCLCSLFMGCEFLAIIGIPTYNNYAKKGYATEAKTQIKSIVQAADMYATENGNFPPDCWETMEDEGYIEIKKSVTNKWEFECNFAEEGEGGWISATSTEEMSGGIGNTVEFDIDTGRFTGYGQGRNIYE